MEALSDMPGGGLRLARPGFNDVPGLRYANPGYKRVASKPPVALPLTGATFGAFLPFNDRTGFSFNPFFGFI